MMVKELKDVQFSPSLASLRIFKKPLTLFLVIKNDR
jgi:hypothetical protein